MENMELDLVIFEDENGNELKMEVLDYLNYEGKPYALLAEYKEDATDDDVVEAFVMEIVPVEGDDEMEEFIPVDEELAEKLIEIFQSNDFEEIGEFEDEE